MNMACWHNDTTIVTLYATLGDDALTFCIDENSLETVFVDKKSFDSIIRRKKDGEISTI